MSAGTATTVSAPAAAGSAASVQGQAVAVVDASRIAVAAARAVLLEAIVQGRASDGVVTLKTQQGNVQIRSTTPLPTGATVALELTRNSEQLSARLLPAATLRAPSTGGTPPTATPTFAPPGGSNATTTTTASAMTSPDQRPTSVGNATFGAVALASDLAAPRRSPSASTPPESNPKTTAGAATQTPRDTTGSAAMPAPGRGAMPGAQPAPTAPVPAPPTTIGTASTALIAGAVAPNETASPVQTAAGVQTPRAPAVQAQAAATPGPAAPPTTTTPGLPAAPIPDASVATRAAAAAIYAQARPNATPRAASSAQVAGTPIASLRPDAELPAIPRAADAGSHQTNAPTASTTPRLQPGTTLHVRIASTTPQAPSAGARAAQPLPATVVGATPQGRLVVDTPLGRLAVSVPPDLLATPPGETLSLEWLPETARAPLSGEDSTQRASSTRSWPQARDAATALLARAEPAAREAADQLVPKPGPRLAQQMMGFIGRGDGDVARWLGEAVMRQLEQLGLTELVARAEGGATREPDRQPANGDWRHVTMPLFDGTQLRPIEIRARRRNGGQAEGGRDQSRFVVDCLHDELGAVQIDGLMTAAHAKKRLDVILRSHVALPEGDRTALAALFADTCGAMGLGGEIAFQVLDRFPVVADNPLAHRAVIA